MNLPIGSIIIWSGDLTTIPEGWQRCDGTNGTPNLNAKFIRGAASDGEVGTGGGSNSHTHTIASSGSESIASHNHFFSGSTQSGGTGTLYSGVQASFATAGHGHYFSNNTGNASSSHTHSVADALSADGQPPFVVYIYIMRIL